MNRRFVLVRRPHGLPVAADFELRDEALTPLGPGEVRVANRYASLDPAIRGWLDDAPSYMPPVALGEAVRASTVGTVLESRLEGFAPGDWVLGLNAIETVSTVRADGFTMKIDPAAVPSVTNYLSVFGAVGATAWFGLHDLGCPKPGDTVLVSGAAGAVGSLVGQLAKAAGCRTIGIAGGAAKCARLTARYGYHASIDYRGLDATGLTAAIAAAAPKGVDIVFENVGGDILDAALMNLRDGARVVLCGLISEYNTQPVGARNLWQLIVHAASIRGLLIRDYAPRFGESAAALGALLADGRLVVDEHVETGIDNALPAFLKLFSGGNDGKLILEI